MGMAKPLEGAAITQTGPPKREAANRSPSRSIGDIIEEISVQEVEPESAATFAQTS
jgi:hypothetical protein